MRAPTNRRQSVALGAACVVPLLAVTALAGAIPSKSFNNVELASERATATESSMLCPGPMMPPKKGGAQSSDAEFHSVGPSTKVGFRAIAVEPNSNLLFGQSSVSETQLDETGQPKRPKTSVVNRDGSDAKVKTTQGTGDFSLVGAFGVEQPFTVTSTSSEQTQPVLDSVQGMITASGDYRSLSLARCEGVGVDRTFMGISTQPGDQSTLVLHNPGDRAARASLTIAAEKGLVESSSASEVVVAPGATERVNIQSLAPNHERIALRATVDGSALGMHVETAERDGLTPMGAEHIASQTPATRQVIPGVRIHGGRAADVSVFNTSGVPADATVRLRGSNGSQVGRELKMSDIAGGAVTSAEVKGPDGIYTVEVESSANVAAVARSTVAGHDMPGETVAAPEDFAMATPAPSITNSSLLALGNRATGGTMSLYAERDAKVDVIGIKADGSFTSGKSLTLTKNATANVVAKDVGASEGDVVGFVVVPDGSGKVHGAWNQMVDAGESGPITSSVTLENNNVTSTGMDVQARS